MIQPTIHPFRFALTLLIVTSLIVLFLFNSEDFKIQRSNAKFAIVVAVVLYCLSYGVEWLGWF